MFLLYLLKGFITAIILCAATWVTTDNKTIREAVGIESKDDYAQFLLVTMIMISILSLVLWFIAIPLWILAALILVIISRLKDLKDD